MDNVRLILLMALSVLGLMLWQAWQQDYGARPEAGERQSTPAASAPAPAAPGGPESAAPRDVPSVPADDLPEVDTPVPAAAAPGAADAVPSRRRIRVETDLLAVEIDPRGGTIARAALKAYPAENDTPDEPLVLLQDSGEALYVAQSALLGGEGAALPDHHAELEAEQQRYTLGDRDALAVDLRWRDEGSGVQVVKTLRFERGSYQVEVRHRVINAGTEPLSVRQYQQLQRRYEKKRRSLIYTFTGVAMSTPEDPYEKYGFDELDENPVRGTYADAWVAMMEHYFISALIPAAGLPVTYYSKQGAAQRYLVGYYTPVRTVAPGETVELEGLLYVGPKEQDRLAEIAPHLELSVDYGVLWFIAKPLFVVLQLIHELTGNWGWSIILLTIIVKAAFFYPSAMGYRSMAKMRKVTPRMQQIKERYKDDKQRQQQAMMQLFKEEQINPLGGCFPILIQIPVFIALYWVLLESVELRHAPFMLWLSDLSSPDPYFVLPLVMGATMFLQQKLNPAPIDPIQAKVMQFLPVAFTVMFAWFPAGLVLYWTVSNILSIGQQWVITRKIEQS